MASFEGAITIAVLADLHYGADSPVPERRSDIADILLMRAVCRLNRLIRPDITLVLGDLLDDGSACDAQERLVQIRSILDKLNSPYIAVPGNHDSDAEAFYQAFGPPKDVEDICGIRFLSFVDQEEPGFNARRSVTDIARLRMARSNHRGPIVSLQHVCLFPPSQASAPYNYTNACEIIAAMKEAGVMLSISGHYHPGAENSDNGSTTFINAPGLCEAPFPFFEVTLNREQILTKRHELAMPKNLKLVDNHLHTQLAYCNDNMTVESAICLANDFGLAGVGFAEHSGQLYYDRERYWGGTCFREGVVGAREKDCRMSDYLALKKTYACDAVRFGLEVDCDYQGNLLLKPDDRAHFDHLAGAIHSIPSMTPETPPTEAVLNEFLFLLESFLANNINVLAHPFRVLRKGGWMPPKELFQHTARLLRKHHTAAEINFHTNEPPVEFIRVCLECGVKFSFGSDAHHLYEVGEFASHLALLSDAGFDGDLSDILAPQNIVEPLDSYDVW